MPHLYWVSGACAITGFVLSTSLPSPRSPRSSRVSLALRPTPWRRHKGAHPDRGHDRSRGRRHTSAMRNPIPGAIGINGLLEKDVDLDVGMRLAALLRADLVSVVMTRSTDVYVSAATRRQISITQHAALVVSIHADTASNPMTDGSLVMYPDRASIAFARTLDDALSAQIAGDGVPDGGVAFGDAAWTQSPVPVANVEMAYLSNGTEAALWPRRRSVRTWRSAFATASRHTCRRSSPGAMPSARGAASSRGRRRPARRLGVGDVAGNQRVPVPAGDRVAGRDQPRWTGAAVSPRRRARPRGAHRARRASVGGVMWMRRAVIRAGAAGGV